VRQTNEGQNKDWCLRGQEGQRSGPPWTSSFRRDCRPPITGRNVVGVVITDLAVFARSHQSGAAFELATAPGVSAAKHILAHRVYAARVEMSGAIRATVD
jgi:acyl CoA:acetate/3-ketoacid CoA transferase beta subunit